MKHLIKYKLFESEYKSIIDTLKDLLIEFEDNNCQCKLFPDDEIFLLKIMSNFNQPFYLEIDVFNTIKNNSNQWYDRETDRNVQIFSLPDWFISNCRRIEDYMQSEGFITKPSIRYALDWENLDTIDELADHQSLIYKVRLEFNKVNSLSEARSDRELTQTISYIKQLEIAEFLRDLSLVLWDDNFNVQVSHTALRNADDIVFTVNISKRSENRFFFDDVKEVVQSMQNYMESEGFVIKDYIQVCDATGWHSVILKDNKLTNHDVKVRYRYSDREFDHLIGLLEINFCKN